MTTYKSIVEGLAKGGSPDEITVEALGGLGFVKDDHYNVYKRVISSLSYLVIEKNNSWVTSVVTDVEGKDPLAHTQVFFSVKTLTQLKQLLKLLGVYND